MPQHRLLLAATQYIGLVCYNRVCQKQNNNILCSLAISLFLFPTGENVYYLYGYAMILGWLCRIDADLTAISPT